MVAGWRRCGLLRKSAAGAYDGRMALPQGSKDQRVVFLEAFNRLSALLKQTRDAGKACEYIAQLNALKTKLKGLEQARKPKNSKHIG